MRLESVPPDLRDIPAPPDARRSLSPPERRQATRTDPKLAQRVGFLVADGQAATPLEQEALLGDNDLVEASFVDRLVLVSRCVARLKFETPDGRGMATGFLVAPGLLMTNHHVFPRLEQAQGATATFDYKRDLAGRLQPGEDYDLDPDAFFVSDADLDFAVVAVKPTSAGGEALASRGYLRLNPESGKVVKAEFVTIVQYPDGDPMRIALRENEVTRAEDGEPAIWYRADTAHGSSGAPVFNDSFQVAALHKSGHIARTDTGEYKLRSGGSAPTLDGLGEGDVVWDANVGSRVSHICPALVGLAAGRPSDYAARLAAAMAGGDVLATAVDVKKSGGSIGVGESRILSGGYEMASSGGAGLVIPLQLRVSLEVAGAAGVRIAGVETGDLAEEALKFRIPVIYDHLETRTGFDRAFLGGGADVPMPKLTDAGKAELAPVEGEPSGELRYHKFSVWMHASRRLPLLTASNVDWTARKKIVDGKSTSRASLAGFPPSPAFMEQWVTDPRVAAAHQLPDVFYSEDGGAFDKGHIVRRDDVCWGKTFVDIQMGNGDTYHVTNCTPQIKGFNQSTAGTDNWGDLEELVQKSGGAEQEKVVIFAGPVLAPDDRWFRGKDDGGPIRVQVPRRFWKIVVAPGPKAYGFILGQDVTSITEAEFAVTANFKAAWRPIREIEALLRGWLSLEALIAKDQHADA